EQLWEEFRYCVTGRTEKGCSEDQVEAAIRQADQARSGDLHAWMVHLLSDQCLKLRTFIFQWRDLHLNLPRNNLGGESTKSLTGSPDAVQAVRNMLNAARNRDPMLPLARERALLTYESDRSNGELTRYLESESSLDRYILGVTGKITQRRFKEVQERLGFF